MADKCPYFNNKMYFYYSNLKGYIEVNLTTQSQNDIKMPISKLANPEEVGKIGLYYLKTVWTHFKLQMTSNINSSRLDWKYINAVFNALGIGLEPTMRYFYMENPSFDEFEDWILEQGTVSKEMILQFNKTVENLSNNSKLTYVPVLSEEDLKHWEEYGYVILKNAVTKEDCKEAVKIVCETIGADLNDPESWYKNHPLKQGIMVQLFQHPTLDKIRFSEKIKQAYLQLWQRNDLLISMDRVSFNPPETTTYHFPGPNLHWDVSLKTPIPKGLQGLLYLIDTPANQGAFTLVPSFHNTIEDWLTQLPKNANPREQDLTSIAKPIAANAGDFIIWHHALPHGSSPNQGKLPRIVQYINYQPLNMEYQKEWI